MSKSVIIIDTSEIREGKLADLKEAMTGLAGFVEAHESEIIAYNVYINGDGTRLTVLQIHPDSASAEFHMKVAGSAFPGFAELIRMTGIDIYGDPGHELLEMLKRKARMLGSGTVVVHRLHAGFFRYGVPNPDAAGFSASSSSSDQDP
jgi:hypothetical protein